MDIHITGYIIAIVALKSARDKISSGTVPIIFVDDDNEQQRISMYLSRIFKAMAHDLENGIYILVKQY